MIGQSDAKMILLEIKDILNVNSEDPVAVLETIRKMEKVVKAVPRMENFITNISRTLAEDPSLPVALEQIIPRVGYLRDLELQHRSLSLAISGLLSIP